MAAQQAARVREKDEPVEEIYYRKGDIDFCFLLNRRHRNLRVFDYRVGNYQQKRDFFDRIARAEGLKKVFTVVEKQDSKSWRSVGFSREGAIPGYFRTADAYIMSRVYTEDGEPIQGGAPKLTSPSMSSKTTAPAKPKGLTVEAVTDDATLKRIAETLGNETLYSPFRRGMFHPDVALHAKQGKREHWIGAETDSSFGHAKVDVLSSVEEEDIEAVTYALSGLLEELAKMDTASVFSMCPVDLPIVNRIYNDMGFKVTARLTDHVVREGSFVGIQLWHRRLSQQSTPRMPSFI